MIDGPDDGERAQALGEQGALAQCLRQPVGVGPAEGAGALATALHELGDHPELARELGALADGRIAGRPDLLARFAHEAVLVLGHPGVGLELAPPGPGRVELGVHVHPRFGGGGARCPLEHEARARAGGVGRGDVDHVRVGPARPERADEVQRAKDVELEHLVERLVEGDRGGAVDHDVDPGERPEVGPAEALAAQVAGQRAEPAGLQERLGVDGPEMLEGPAGEDLVHEAALGAVVVVGPEEQADPAELGQRPRGSGRGSPCPRSRRRP